MVELLAPAGSREALTAAVESGANAVYLAGKSFGARAYADNFDREELKEAIRYAHLRGVAIYVTVNTLVDQNEAEDLADYLRFLYEAGVDAIIIQDLGAVYLAKKILPELPLHASTQMTVTSLPAAKFLEKQGFQTVVLAREVSLEDIKTISEGTDALIETFIHGALCVCYSGQCLMSGMIGGRSGNRGRCAQPCRLPYQLVDDKGDNMLAGKDVGQYLLSPRDFCTIDKLPDVVKAGARSLKIEGRMKRPEYVAVVVDAYRQSLDSIHEDIRYAVDALLKKDLTQIFNRDFTTAYLEKKPGKMMMSDRRPNNRGVRIGRIVAYDAKKKLATMRLDERLQVGDIIDIWVKVGGRVNTTIQTMTIGGREVESAEKGAEVTFSVPSHVRVSDRAFKVYDAALMERAKSFYAGGAPVRRVGVAAEVFVAEGQPLTLTLRDAEGNIGVGQTDFLAEAARKRPLSIETVQKQLERLGTTMFTLDSLDFQCEGELMVPVSELNEVRRRAVAQLEETRLAKYERAAATYRTLPKLPRNDRETKPLLTVHTDTIEKVETAYQNGADIVLFGGENFSHHVITHADYSEAARLAKAYGKQIIFATPRIAKQWQMKTIEEDLLYFNEIGGAGVSVGNLGVLALAQKISKLPIHADFSLNIYNAYAVDYLKEQGIASVTLSPELNFGQAERLVRRAALPTECIVHGHLPLMVSEYCVLGSFLGDIDKKPCPQVCTKQQYYLQDRMSERFPIVTDQFCRMHILNTKELSMLPHVGRFGEIGVDRIRIEGKYMSAEELADLVRRYRVLLNTGHSLTEREMEKWTYEKENITRGHYFRGVL